MTLGRIMIVTTS